MVFSRLVHCPLSPTLLSDFHLTHKKEKLFISLCSAAVSWFFALPQSGLLIYWRRKKCEGKKFPNRAGEKTFFFGEKCVRIMLCWPHGAEKKKYKFFSIFHNNRQAMVSSRPIRNTALTATTHILKWNLPKRKNIWKNSYRKK